mgnify:CR=1 FL=1
MTDVRAERILVCLTWVGIFVAAIAGILALTGCSTNTERITTDLNGNEIREIQREEFDKETFDYVITRILTSVPQYYEVYLNMQRERLLLRQQTLEIERAEGAASDAEYNARLDAIIEAIKYIDARVQAYNKQKQQE